MAYIADSLKFGADGRYQAGFRKGTAGHGGLWSLVRRPRGSGDVATLVQIPESNDGDLRTPFSETPYTVESDPEMRNGVLVFFGSSYYRENDSTDVRLFTFDRYTHSVRCTARWRGPFRSGEAKEIEWTFENVDPKGYAKELQKLRITELGLAFDRSFKAIGEPRPLIDLALEGKLNDGESQVRKIVLTLTVKGEFVMLKIDFDFEDSIQPYHAYHGFVASVAGD